MVKLFLDEPVKSDVRTYNNMREIATGQGDNYTTSCLLDYKYLHKIRQSRGYLGWILRPFLKMALSLMKNVLKQLAKSILIPLGLTAAVSAIDAALHKKMSRSSWQH